MHSTRRLAAALSCLVLSVALAFGVFSAGASAAGSPVRLTARVVPASTAGGTVVFQRYDARKRAWKQIASARLSQRGQAAVATCSWRAAPGSTKLRARYLGGALNAASSSAVAVVRGR
jgi:hypothetical protein